jgi:hypothetical protein
MLASPHGGAAASCQLTELDNLFRQTPHFIFCTTVCVALST